MHPLPDTLLLLLAGLFFLMLPSLVRRTRRWDWS